MDGRQLASEIQDDLRRAPRGVIYLEGKTDLPIFFALLGVAAPRDGIWQGILVEGLDGRKSGAAPVRERVQFATEKGYRGVFGIVDGDGVSHAELAADFDPPAHGPLFRWKAYCIENLLVKAGWPPEWGAAPDWTEVLADHAPYVALNRIHRNVSVALMTLRLHRFQHPVAGEALLTASETEAALRRDQHGITARDLVGEFVAAVDSFRTTVATDLDAAHALASGKWLVEAFAMNRSGKSRDECRRHWAFHVVQTGGLAEVREFWKRLTGQSP